MWLDINAGNNLQGKTYETRVVVNAVQENGKINDVVPPTIQLAGELSINVEENEIFEDPGIEKITDNQDILEEKNIQRSYEYYDGESTKEVKNVDTSKIGVYYIYYRIQDQSGNEGIAVRSVNVYHKDTNAPIIKLIGDKLQRILLNGEYIEEGATAIDQEEGDISSRIVTIGTVNTKVLGSYSIKYLITDQSGNTSSIVRVVNVEINTIEGERITLDLTNKTSEQIEIEGENKEDLTYKSTNGDIVDVDENGIVTAKKIGRTTIEVESKTGNKYIIEIVVEKTVKVDFIQQGLGVTGIGAEEDYCTITEEGETCSIDLPKINVKTGYTAVGWSKDQNDQNGENGTIQISDSDTYYAISYKNEVTYKVNFNANGNAIDEESESCILGKSYNETPQASSCEVTTPIITAPEITPTVVGYNQSASATSAEVESGSSLAVDSNNQGKTYYAITTKKMVTLTGTFTKGTGASSVGSGSVSCNIAAVYNGKTQGTTCSIKAPTITASSGYLALGWSTSSSGSVSVNVGASITLSKNQTYYTVCKADAGVSYSAHVQTSGWLSYASNGATSGATSGDKRIEALKIKLVNNTGISGGISYTAHVQSDGWQKEVSNDAIAGTTGEKKRLEAIRIRLTGNLANYYDVWYRAYCESFGWLDWAKNNANAGTKGYAYKMYAIQVKLLHKNSSPPGTTTTPYKEKVSTLSIKSSKSVGSWQTCVGYWYENKYQFNITSTGYSVSSGQLCYAANSSSVSSYCKSYPNSGNTGAGDACFNSATSWTFYRSNYCAYAYVCNSNGTCTSKYQC